MNITYEEFVKENKIKPFTFGELINSIRITDDYTMAKFAEILGVSAQYINAIEKEKRKVTIAQAAKFANILGYPSASFISAVVNDYMRNHNLNYEACIIEKNN